jgi:hypothetical protein
VIIWTQHSTPAIAAINSTDIGINAEQIWSAKKGQLNVGHVSRIVDVNNMILAHVAWGRKGKVIDAWYLNKDTRPMPSIDDSKKLIETKFTEWLEKNGLTQK